MTTITTTAAPVSSKSEVLNLRLDSETKQAIAELAIADGRSMSQIALRAIRLGIVALVAPPAPAPAPAVDSTPVKGKGRGKGKGGGGAAPAAPAKPKPKK